MHIRCVKYNYCFDFIVFANVLTTVLLFNKLENTPMATIVRKIKSETIQNFAQAFLSENINIGVFQPPVLTDSKSLILPLQSGIIPELQEGYQYIADYIGIQKLYLIKSIKGYFDNVIFLPLPDLPPLAEPPDKTDFEPTLIYSGSKWILLLKSGFNYNNIPLNDWVTALVKAGKDSYINPKTVFLEAFNSNSAICLEWSNDFIPPLYLEMETEKFIWRLEMIQEALTVEDINEKQELQKLMEQFEDSSTAKAIVEIIYNTG